MLSDFLIHTVTITRQSFGKYSTGGAKADNSETTLHTSIAACVQPLPPTAAIVYAQHDAKCSHLVYTETDVSDVSVNDLIYYGTQKFTVSAPPRNFIGNGRVWEIQAYTYAN